MANTPVTGAAATIGSVTSGTDLKQIVDTAITLNAWVPNFISDSSDTTPLAGLVARNTAGLRSGEVGFRGVYPRGTPRYGASGLVTFASGYVFICSQYSVTFDWGEADITGYTGAAQTWKRFRPGEVPRISGTFDALVSDDTTPALPTAANGSGAAVTFKLAEDGTADPSIAGNIVVTGNSYDEITALATKLPLRYSFVGGGTTRWTTSAGDTLPPILPAGDIDAPDWDANGDGAPDVSATFTLASGRTLTAPVFIRTLTVASSVNGIVTVSGTLRIAGDVTVA